MIPNEKRINEILFFWLMHYYNKCYDYDKTARIMQMYCELTRVGEHPALNYDKILNIRENMIQRNYCAPSIDETLWTLHNAGYSFRFIARLTNKNKDTMLRHYVEIKHDERRQYTYGNLLEPDDYVCVERYMNAVREFDFKWIMKKH